MFDLIGSSFQSMSTGAASASMLVFGVGVLSSAGPCVAPRFIAVTGLVLGESRPAAIQLTAGFLAGLVAVYISFGLLSSLLLRISGFSQQLYLLLAGVMLVGALLALIRPSEQSCAPMNPNLRCPSVGGALLLGASSALVVSPCCTPLLLGIVSYTSAVSNPGYGALLLGCFALGHATPVFILSAGANRLAEIVKHRHMNSAASTVACGLMMFLAGYYAVLA